jgi:hypothetical protein
MYNHFLKEIPSLLPMDFWTKKIKIGLLTRGFLNYDVDIEIQSKWFGVTKYVKIYYLNNLYLKTLS